MLGIGGAALMRRRSRLSDEDVPREEATYSAPREMEIQPVPPTRQTASTPLAASGQESRLEAMVAAPPSPENPFRTYAKRLTRAKFLLARENAANVPGSAPAATPAAPARPVPQPQTVYRFGSDRARKSLFNPRTS